MPSPFGHALGGLAAGWLVAGRSTSPALDPGRPVSGPRRLPAWAWYALLGAAPDADLLFGTHNTYSHSLGATAAVMAVVAASGFLRRTSRDPRTLTVAALASGAAYASHLLLDWLGTDTSPPFGIMALWPLDDGFYKAPIAWFLPVSRRVFSVEFWIGTPLAAVTELLMLGPLAWLVGKVRRRP